MDAVEFVMRAAIAGLVATAVLDMWQTALSALLGTPSTNWALVGRWFSGLQRGTLVHENIGLAEPAPHEGAVGWAAHYAVGVAYAAIYLAMMGYGFGSGPSLVSALAFGAVTVAAPWFVLQPGMGMGLLAAKAPRPWSVRARSLISHIVFGAGLFLGTLPGFST
jgi:hypothetical protein